VSGTTVHTYDAHGELVTGGTQSDAPLLLRGYTCSPLADTCLGTPASLPGSHDRFLRTAAGLSGVKTRLRGPADRFPALPQTLRLSPTPFRLSHKLSAARRHPSGSRRHLAPAPEGRRRAACTFQGTPTRCAASRRLSPGRRHLARAPEGCRRVLDTCRRAPETLARAQTSLWESRKGVAESRKPVGESRRVCGSHLRGDDPAPRLGLARMTGEHTIPRLNLAVRKPRRSQETRAVTAVTRTKTG
jgi:hypothetical protein